MTIAALPGLPDEGRTTVAIIGGGFTGAVVAYHLANNQALAGDHIVVFEPRAAIGKGLAYDTSDPAHRINVPAGRMSILADEPDHFLRWVAANDAVSGDPDAVWPDGNIFPRRGVFGQYVHSNVKPLLDSGRIRHARSSVAQVTKADGGWSIKSDDGTVLHADVVVIAATHPAPTPPSLLSSALRGHPRYIEDATIANALHPIRPDDHILIVGNGLTAADVIASLALRGHKGQILALSRRGLRSRGHAPFPQEPYGDFADAPPRTARELLARIRKEIRNAAAQGLTWHPVLDQVRAQGNAIWQKLPMKEKRRIVRHLRVYWDVHRFRIAPQVEQALDRGISEGRLTITAASLVSARQLGDEIEVTIRRKGAYETKQHFDAVIVTTGPAHTGILSSQSWLAAMAQQGHLLLHETGLGIACDENGYALTREIEADPTLFIAGPLARGHFGELMGLPQVSEYAAFIAESVAKSLA